MNARSKLPGLNRRGFLASSAGLGVAGLGAAGLTASRAAAASALTSSRGQSASSLAEVVLAALRKHRVVALGWTDGGQETGDLLTTLISDPRLYGVVNDIIVEFGDAFYQDTLDRFILGDKLVNDADLRLVWRNTTQSPVNTWDGPVYEQIYRRVRAVNWTLPPGRRIRVLAGDPPFDWSKVTSRRQVPLSQRDTYPASVVEQEVLAKGRRALLFYGGDHLLHNNARSGGSGGGATITSIVERKTGTRVYVILDLMPLTTDPGRVFARLAAHPRGSVIPTAGTWLGHVSAGDVLGGSYEGRPGQPGELVNPFCGKSLGQLVDAGLYLGQAADMTQTEPNPAIFLDPVYWAELRRRNAIQGNIVDLETYRQQQPPAFPLGQYAKTCAAGT
jgi:hypothetical protein